MPTILRVGPYRFSFFSNEGNEAPHVHVKSAENEAKFWLDPVVLESNRGFNVKELGQIERIIIEHQVDFMEAWDVHFGN